MELYMHGPISETQLPPQSEATYPYHDADGRLLFERILIEFHRGIFRGGKWLVYRRPGSLESFDPTAAEDAVPYRLPELRQARKDGRPICLVYENFVAGTAVEQIVERLRKWGFAATRRLRVLKVPDEAVSREAFGRLFEAAADYLPQTDNGPPDAEPANDPSEPPPRPNRPLTIARGYLARGWNPIPVSLQTKKPIGNEWQLRPLDSTTVAAAFNHPDMNVGVQLGPYSHGLTDVDLDCREAVLTGPMFLPGSNSIFGRASKLRSHWLYNSTLAGKISKACLQFRDAAPNGATEGAMLLELKIGGGGKGSQSVFPGSVHTSGETIEWSRDGALITVDDDVLLRQVHRLAVAVLLARHWPADGSRHDAALTVGGFLARAGFNEDEAALMLEAIAKAAGDEEEDDRVKAGRDAVKNYANGSKTRGLPKLKETFGDKVTKKAAEWLNYKGETGITPDEPVEQQPLTRPLSPPEPFPLEAMGPELAAAAQAIRDLTQTPLEMCASGVLASASFTASAHINIELPTGQMKPVVNWFWSIAVSGERKTAVDDHAFGPQKQHEKTLHSRHKAELESFKVEHKMWEAQVKRIDKQYSKEAAGSEAHRKELEMLGPEPEAPLGPLLMASNFTIEGLELCLQTGQPLYGIIGSEGGQFIGGHGMVENTKLHTITNLCSGWDGEPHKKARAAGLTMLYGRRIGMHLMVQPEVAAAALADELLIKQGFLARILICYPESLIGKRMHREPSPGAMEALQQYKDRMQSLIETPYPLVPGTRNELKPRNVPFSQEATALFWEFSDEAEKQMAPGGEYESIQAFAAKLAEHAARLGAAIAAYHDFEFTELSREDFIRGMQIAFWYASEAKRIGVNAVSSNLLPEQLLGPAQKLLDWLKREWTKDTVSARDIYTFGPGSIRNRQTAISLAETLEEHGYLEPIDAKQKNMRKWKIVKGASQ
jgi:hypothetical protein